jgi:hypothetical protein
MQAVHTEYAERYVEALGVRPSRSTLALVNKLNPLTTDSIDIRTCKVGYRRDEVHVTPTPAQANLRSIGGRRPAHARVMVRIAAANAALDPCHSDNVTTGGGACGRRNPTHSGPHGTETQAVGAAPASTATTLVDENAASPTPFDAAVQRFLLPFCLVPTLRKEQQALRAVDVHMPGQVSKLRTAMEDSEALTDPMSSRCACAFPSVLDTSLGNML